MVPREHPLGPKVERFASREAASLFVAEAMRAAIERRLGGAREAAIVVSGGSTPERCFQALSGSELPWERVTVVPSDERWVPTSDARSNERFLRRALLVESASKARVFPLYRAHASPEVVADEIDAELPGLPLPFACTLLGMGEDGHFASLFPDAANLAAGLDPDGERLAMVVRTAASDATRLSLTLAALARSDEVWLLFFGEPKWRTFEAATASIDAYPASHLLTRLPVPLRAVWAP